MSEALRSVRIVAKRAETPDIATFELAANDGRALPPYTAGAHIDVEVSPGLIRQYSLCALPNPANTYRIGVLKDPGSRGGSVALHGRGSGETLRISEPRNHFALADDPRTALLFAGGIGVTPLIAMAEELHATGRAFELHYCARSIGHAAFRDDLAQSAYAKNVHLHLDDGDAAQRLDIDAVLAANPASHLYVCGPGGFIGWIEAAATRAGIEADYFHREYFKPDPAATVAPGGAFTVQLARSGLSIAVSAEVSILSALAARGIQLEKSCEAGVCGTCLTRVIDGTPDHRDYYLTAAEKAKGDQILPCCSRSASAVLVLDL